MEKIPYNIVTIAKSANGKETRTQVGIGNVEQNEMGDIIRAYCIIDYSGALTKELEANGYQVANIEDHPNFEWRKMTLTDGSTITITTKAA